MPFFNSTPSPPPLFPPDYPCFLLLPLALELDTVNYFQICKPLKYLIFGPTSVNDSLLIIWIFIQAANPGCILEDFVRWYSPLDWVEYGTLTNGVRELEAEEMNGKSEKEKKWGGSLSPRMLAAGILAVFVCYKRQFCAFKLPYFFRECVATTVE